jgi:hypothetical protein
MPDSILTLPEVAALLDRPDTWCQMSARKRTLPTAGMSGERKTGSG